MPKIKFTVDAHLIEELGERLVGQHYIALAELVKNGYDADAHNVNITLDTEKDLIRVKDDGHGMTFEEFRDYWMRIGSTHKREQEISRHFKRPLTGSKGVGRLAVQFLAEEIKVFTVSERYLNKKLQAKVVWSEAVRAEDLTEATAYYDEKEDEEGFDQGTTIVLKGLNHEWNEDDVKGLAKEIWWLQPPFRRTKHIRDPKDFRIKFTSKQKDLLQTFKKQQKAFLEVWHAKLIGRNEKGTVNISLEFYGEAEPITQRYEIPNCALENGNFEIRFYTLSGKQRGGILVNDLRDYMDEFSGVHIYDGGFHLPYYGQPESDWLKIEFDHAHRKNYSELLPKEWRIKRGLQHLPTLRRIFSVVNVSTSREKQLKIQITRDRLVDNQAYRDLTYMVRWAIDYYALERAKRVFADKEALKEIEAPSEKFEHVGEVLEYYKDDIPEKVYEELKEKTEDAMSTAESEAEAKAKQIGLLGPIATAGISSLAFQHELKRQFDLIDEVVERLDDLKTKYPKAKAELDELKVDLSNWVSRSRETNALFSPLADVENVRLRKRFHAGRVIKETIHQVKSLARDIPIQTDDVDDDLLLPEASLVEWNSIFQNILINAFNALFDVDQKIIDISSWESERQREIIIQDTGVGVDLKNSKKLFEPFERKVKISKERRGLGYGGTGLGLTIVKLITENIGCNVSFVEPEEGFNTAFSIRWREKNGKK